MQQNNFKMIVENQRQFFSTGKTLSITFRIEQLKKLKLLINSHEEEIVEALHRDLHKSRMEAVASEILFVIDEINVAIKNIKKWARPLSVSTPFPLLWPGRSEIRFEPYGSVLIFSPWNYPFLLTIVPLVGAISAGNCAILKPSEITTHTEKLILRLISDYFSPEYVTAIQCDPEKTTELLQEKFDYIFFTGGMRIGKIVMEAAAKHLTPVTLELGGKSPCIVDNTADLDFAARRIIWGKLINTGQTCIAPDYLLVHQSCKEKLIENLKKAITQFYGDNPENSKSYGRIINKKQFDRLIQHIKNGKILAGGKSNQDELYISPTLIDEVSWNDPIMQEEIFGPILPILTFENIDDIIHLLKKQPKPLALYFFTCNKINETKILTQLSFGGGSINDCLMHLVNPNLPFGGVGQSGMGSYHGKYSFETFSHRKSIYKKTLRIDFDLQYPPYTNKKLWWLRKLLRV